MLKMPNCTLTPTREKYHFDSGKSLKSSYTIMNSYDHSNYIGLRTIMATRFIHGTIDSATREEIIEIPIVSKNVENDNDCTKCVLKILLDYFGFYHSIEDIAFQLTIKGYNMSYDGSASIKAAHESFGGMLDTSFAYSLSAIVSTINLINSCAFVLNPDSTILSLLLNSDSLRYDSQFFCQP